MDTIFALATPPGKSGVAVIRISGSASRAVIAALTGREPPPERRLSLRRITGDGQVVDEALVAWFAEGRSFTGEDMTELHLHGGRAIIDRVYSLISGVEGCRPAEPGEFTRRALESGRLDLTQVEGLADLIDAETEAQRRQALALMGGALSDRVARWRDMLVSALALLEASLDFADEEDAPEEVGDEVLALLTRAVGEIDDQLRGARVGEKVRDGFRVVLLGAPNCGKSTLFNRIVGREAALTSPVAGTTRDVLEAACDFGGVPVILQDIAGLREAEDEVEGLGVKRALDVAEAADLRVFLHCAGVPAVSDVSKRAEDILVWTKADLGPGQGDVAISAKTGENVDLLVDRIGGDLSARIRGSEVVARSRQRMDLERALHWLTMAVEDKEDEIRADSIRRAIGALKSLLGEIGVEDVLDEIFSRFCMGK